MIYHITREELPDISHRNGRWELVHDSSLGGAWARAVIPGHAWDWTPEDCPSCNGAGCDGIYLLGTCDWCSDHICHGCGWYVGS
ncbi:hypothetical protein [Nocardia otitidiscaviarum]|uniref:hypothetical protein n=1 Tax=Nocardia otitidiscaviarum TaxID=1823 RepID=UPI001892EF7C|nr:hypothetical protein [Nocardia otitidiscaviarum]MBF6179909.1 hypothetical protein [Nocardia otitidiscaviarum]